MEAQFPFTQVPQAFQKLEEGHARGKTVVRVADEGKSEEMAKSEREFQQTSEHKWQPGVWGVFTDGDVDWSYNECVEAFSVLSWRFQNVLQTVTAY